MATRTLVAKLSSSLSISHLLASRSQSLLRLRPLVSLADPLLRLPIGGGGALRCLSTRPTTSSLNDPSPNWSNRPPKETILLDGCDFEHWLVVMEPPEPNVTRDEIIDSYIKTLAQVVGSEEEARMKIYSVSTKHYFAFGALVSEELSYKIKTLPKVRWVLPDSYLDVKNKDYGGEPFINGQAVPYDPKYHEEWVRNNARANERSRRNDRPRNFDRSRNFERRRENMQNRDFQNRDMPPMPNQDFQNRDGPNPMPPQNAAPPSMPNMGASVPPPPPPPPNAAYQNQMPNPNMPSGPNYQGSRPPYQGSGPGYQGGAPAYQGSQGYQGGNPGGVPGGPGFQGGNPGGGVPGGPGFQGGNPGGNVPGGPGFQGGNPGGNVPGGPGYPGGNPGYQGGSPGYQGSGPGYQGGNPAYQGGGNNYQAGGSSGYQGGNPNYQQGGPSYPGGGPNYQAGGPNYQGGSPAYQGRDVPERDHQ